MIDRHRIARRALGALVLAAATSGAPAGPRSAETTLEDALARADSVVGAAYAAMGPAEARGAIASVTARARAHGPSGTYEMVVRAAAGGRVHMEQRPEQGNAFIGVLNGPHAWTRGTHGLERLERDVAAMVRSHAFQWTALHVRDFFSELSLEGEASFAGRRCYRLRGLDDLEMPCAIYFDTETHLLAGFEIADAIEEGTVVVRFAQWRRVGGVLLPSEVLATDADGDFVLDFHAITLNDVDDALFEVPEALRR
ncbi:MAG: DUF4292 domain-containing protein [Candidatus Krumholzibacteria bacterium]|nr:DUF4292 domain-containing protein [Candidatus Krumholzibacteria bacterium]